MVQKRLRDKLLMFYSNPDVRTPCDVNNIITIKGMRPHDPRDRLLEAPIDTGGITGHQRIPILREAGGPNLLALDFAGADTLVILVPLEGALDALANLGV